MTGSSLGFPALWLRHNCRCAECLDPVTGQRLIEVTAIPNGCGVTVEAEIAESVTVVFAPDGHRAVFRRAWLAARALPAAPPAPGGRSPWLARLAGVPGKSAVPRPAAGSGAAWSGPASSASAARDGEADVGADPRTEDGKRLWLAADLAAPPSSAPASPTSAPVTPAPLAPAPGETRAPAGAPAPGPVPFPVADWDSYLADDAVRAACLGAVARLGFTLLRGVPVTPGSVLRVADTFGFVRETNYGKLFDVRVVADPANLAFTSRATPPHTDNPYRDPVPTLQLLHCLRDASLGGDTGLADGFAAAAALRREDPASFAVLAATPWPFAYADKETELSARAPLIALTPDGRITAVRLNNRSMGPLRLPYEQAEAAYAAYRAWAALLGRPEFQLNLRLAPGDCLVFDNTRVLHARTAFAAPAAAPPVAPAGGPAADHSPGDTQDGAPGAETARERHLQGCYADIDGLLSTLAVLRRVNRASRSPGELVRVWTSAYLGTARPAAGYCPGGRLDGWATGLAPATTVPLSGTLGPVARQLDNGY